MPLPSPAPHHDVLTVAKPAHAVDGQPGPLQAPSLPRPCRNHVEVRSPAVHDRPATVWRKRLPEAVAETHGRRPVGAAQIRRLPRSAADAALVEEDSAAVRRDVGEVGRIQPGEIAFFDRPPALARQYRYDRPCGRSGRGRPARCRAGWCSPAPARSRAPLRRPSSRDRVPEQRQLVGRGEPDFIAFPRQSKHVEVLVRRRFASCPNGRRSPPAR